MSRELYPTFPVLIVDDNTTFLGTVETILLTRGITNVECCSDSKEVLQAVEQIAVKVDFAVQKLTIPPEESIAIGIVDIHRVGEYLEGVEADPDR